jgi:hypothetical protein
MIENPDDLDELLTPRSAASRMDLRDALLRRTERRLARDRWLRRGARVALVAGVFAIGGVAGWVARPTPEPVPVPEYFAIPVIVPVLQSPVADAPASPSPSATEVEMRAELADDRSAAAALYRQAGDAFLREENYANATRCSRLFLAPRFPQERRFQGEVRCHEER